MIRGSVGQKRPAPDDDGGDNPAQLRLFQTADEPVYRFSEGKAMMVNNAEWLMGLNYVELLRR